MSTSVTVASTDSGASCESNLTLPSGGSRIVVDPSPKVVRTSTVKPPTRLVVVENASNATIAPRMPIATAEATTRNVFVRGCRDVSDLGDLIAVPGSDRLPALADVLAVDGAPRERFGFEPEPIGPRRCVLPCAVGVADRA